MLDLKRQPAMEEQLFRLLGKQFGRTIHHWPCIPRQRGRWWQRRRRREDQVIDTALAAIGRGPWTAEMSANYWEQARRGQGIYEDAGGSIWRCWCAALGLPFQPVTQTYSGYFAPAAKPSQLVIVSGADNDVMPLWLPPTGNYLSSFDAPADQDPPAVVDDAPAADSSNDSDND